jgi:Mg2+ and Co2+ transporter CorA
MKKTKKPLNEITIADISDRIVSLLEKIDRRKEVIEKETLKVKSLKKLAHVSNFDNDCLIGVLQKEINDLGGLRRKMMIVAKEDSRMYNRFLNSWTVEPEKYTVAKYLQSI